MTKVFHEVGCFLSADALFPVREVSQPRFYDRASSAVSSEPRQPLVARKIMAATKATSILPT